MRSPSSTDAADGPAERVEASEASDPEPSATEDADAPTEIDEASEAEGEPEPPEKEA